jgi:hypothetical protein
MILLFFLSQSVVVEVLDHCVGCMLDVPDSFNNYSLLLFHYPWDGTPVLFRVFTGETVTRQQHCPDAEPNANSVTTVSERTKPA